MEPHRLGHLTVPVSGAVCILCFIVIFIFTIVKYKYKCKLNVNVLTLPKWCNVNILYFYTSHENTYFWYEVTIKSGVAGASVRYRYRCNHVKPKSFTDNRHGIRHPKNEQRMYVKTTHELYNWAVLLVFLDI